MYVFVRAVDMSLSSIRYREAKDDYDTLHTTPQLGKTSFSQIEKYLSNVYTRNMYYKVQKEMVKEARYLKESKIKTDNGTLLELLKYPECRIRRVVLVSFNNEFFVCECQHVLSFGIPCRHVFAAMKYMKVQDIPKSLLVTRWTKNPYGDETKHYRECENASTEVQARFGRITTKMAEVAYIRAKTQEAYHETSQLLENMSISLQKYDKVENKRGREEEKIKQNDITVEDPHISKTKGTAKMRGSKAVNKRKCTICKKSGHNKRICPQRRTKRADEDEYFDNQYDDETEQSDDALESDNSEERQSDQEMFDQSQRQTSTLPLEDDNVGHKQYTYSTPTSMETWSQWWGSA
ncbi:protein FAR1-RELATED SEQUENCE 1-like [Cannabis sativa]|uniref:protein FAR1-RELATED SEQUENCE 1-like n=1 Tax=Cannabis sativa TaxID=3483 RepID=UPI0029C9C517|nr:protein FAR1-RELATED SEQUENCE 1-like [Cannabis sativa]